LSRKKDEQNPKTSTTISLAPDDLIATVNLDDKKLKIIAEELSNTIGKNIIQLLSVKKATTKEIASILDESIQRVSYHIKRLGQIDVIKTDGYRTSEKGKQMKVYTLKKSSLLLVLDTPQKDKTEVLKKLKRMAMRKTLKHLGICAIFFTIIYIIIHRILFSMVKKAAENAGIPIFPGGEHYIVLPSIIKPINDVIPLYVYSVPLIAGIILVIASWTYLRRNHIPLKI